MLRIFLDTDIILDAALHQTTFGHNARALIRRASLTKCQLFISPLSLVALEQNLPHQQQTHEVLQHWLTTCTLAPLDAHSFQQALALSFTDFNRALKVAGALTVNANAFITRDLSAYLDCPLNVLSPGQALAKFEEN
jgi:predicted nucleic acid-binding protein